MRTATIFCFSLCLTAHSAAAGVIYDAWLGTLPQQQGWAYSGDQGNAPPTIVDNSLHVVKTLPNTAQYWTISDPMDVDGHIFLQGFLKVNSSNYIPNVGTGTREGYYFILSDQNSLGYDLGLASNGFNINTIGTPNAPLRSYPVAGDYHSFVIDVNNGTADIFIDHVLQASGILPYFAGNGIDVNIVRFGPAAGFSISDTNLQGVCETTGGECSITPEPANIGLVGAPFALLLWALRRRFPRDTSATAATSPRA